MRGEVALVNRNILIEGEPTSDGKQMGGHIKVGKWRIKHSYNVQNLTSKLWVFFWIKSC